MGFYGKYLENSVEKRVKVGIIDRGFRGFTAAANNGDLPPPPSGNRTESDRVKTKCDDRLTPDSDTRRDNRPFIGTPAHTISPRSSACPRNGQFWLDHRCHLIRGTWLRRDRNGTSAVGDKINQRKGTQTEQR